MKSIKNDSFGLKGVVYRRLYSRDIFYALLKKEGFNLDIDLQSHTFNSLYLTALKAGIKKELLDSLVDKSAKPMFKENALWKFLKKNYNLDLAIPFVTGYYTKKAVKGNLVVTRGKQIVAERIGGTGTQGAVTAIAIGVGAVAAAAGDTALGSESTTNGGTRGAATITNVAGTTTLSKEQWVKTFSFSGSLAITEEGLFDNNTSGGNMLARQVFSAVNVVNGDSLQVTHTVDVT